MQYFLVNFVFISFKFLSFKCNALGVLIKFYWIRTQKMLSSINNFLHFSMRKNKIWSLIPFAFQKFSFQEKSEKHRQSSQEHVKQRNPTTSGFSRPFFFTLSFIKSHFLQAFLHVLKTSYKILSKSLNLILEQKIF